MISGYTLTQIPDVLFWIHDAFMKRRQRSKTSDKSTEKLGKPGVSETTVMSPTSFTTQLRLKNEDAYPTLKEKADLQMMLEWWNKSKDDILTKQNITLMTLEENDHAEEL